MNIARANKEFTEVVNITNVPVVTTIMGRGAVPTDHPLFYRKPGECMGRMPRIWQ